MTFTKKPAKSFGKKEYTSVGVGLFDKGEFMVANIKLERFPEYAKLFREAKEKGVGVAMYIRANPKKRDEKSPDFWLNMDFAKPYKGSQAIEEEPEDATEEF